MKLRRYLESVSSDELSKQMVFLSGPRHVGKTSLGRQLITEPNSYLNWDNVDDRRRILQQQLAPAGERFFDELHKHRSWRSFLKTVCDKDGGAGRILVAGSAQLDHYDYGGDPLNGRFRHLRMHPLSVAELGVKGEADFAQLLKLGGFPEPFLRGQEKFAQRWAQESQQRMLREELPALERIDDFGQLELLLLRLPQAVGAPLSINAIRQELKSSHGAVARWIEILERSYSIFRLSPFTAPKLRAVQKEQKHYHFDWTTVPEPAARFENLVACHLLKWAHYQQDVRGLAAEIRYFRDIDRREVSFVVTLNGQPASFIECQLRPVPVTLGMKYLKARFPGVVSWQIHAQGAADTVSAEGVRQSHAQNFLSGLV